MSDVEISPSTIHDLPFASKPSCAPHGMRRSDFGRNQICPGSREMRIAACRYTCHRRTSQGIHNDSSTIHQRHIIRMVAARAHKRMNQNASVGKLAIRFPFDEAGVPFEALIQVPRGAVKVYRRRRWRRELRHGRRAWWAWRRPRRPRRRRRVRWRGC